MPVQDHRCGSVQGYRNVAVAGTVGLACISFIVVASLHLIAGIALHCTCCRPGGYGAIVQRCNDAPTLTPCRLRPGHRRRTANRQGFGHAGVWRNRFWTPTPQR
jgi:hypothetical protein